MTTILGNFNVFVIFFCHIHVQSEMSVHGKMHVVRHGLVGGYGGAENAGPENACV